MKDRLTKRERSELMAKVRGRGNLSTELVLARLLRANKISGWRRQVQIRGRAALPRRQIQATGHRRPTFFRVRPDFVFRRVRLAIFVDGCFWHGCPKHATKPKNNRAFWQRKLSANKTRDRLVNRTLRRTGWRVIRIWECALKKNPLNCLKRIQRVVLADGHH